MGLEECQNKSFHLMESITAKLRDMIFIEGKDKK